MFLVLPAVTVAGFAQTSVTTWHNDIGRTGQNLNETILTPSNVNPTQFGLLFSQPVDGQIYAQPLYLPNLTINGATHNVVFVATENDSVYAFDADSNGGSTSGLLWQASMLAAAHGAAAGATTIPYTTVSGDIQPQYGITGTPVIDPTTNTLYVVSKSMENGSAVQRLHALDVTTGLEKFGGPVVLTATVTGTGSGSSGSSLTFSTLWENQRPGLLLLNGIVYIGFAAHGDNGPWHGWVLSYNAATLQQTGAYCVSPNGLGGGFWMSGAGLAADIPDSSHPFGRMFIATGNGDYTAAKPYTNAMDYGDSVLNLDLTNGVPTVQDEFTPSDQADLDAGDGDVASGGVMLVPTQTTGSYPHLLVQTGKIGDLYLINRDSMGGYNTTDQVVQSTQYAVGNLGVWSTPAYWNGTVYYWGRFDNLKAFPLVNGQLTTYPIVESTEQYGFPGATPSISANGNTNGIVWSIDSEAYSSSGPAILQAHLATNVATTLYSSATNATRDNPGVAIKFAVPTIVNGKVYVGTASQLSIYGLLNSLPQAATPVISPASEGFTSTVQVTITDSTPGAAIYYTTDGSTPTTSSTVYGGAITVSSTETITAIASAANYLQSATTSATYTNNSQAATPVISPKSGSFTSPQTVTITDATSGAAIYYTTDGSTPTSSSTLYSAPFTVSQSETINAIAAASGVTNSAVATVSYNIASGSTAIDFSQGFASSAGLMVFNGSTDLDDSRLQLTNGGEVEASSAWYYQPVNVQSFSTSFTFQLSNPAADGMTFAIQNAGLTALGGNGGYLGYGGIANSLAVKFDLYSNNGEGPDSTGLYLNGAIPETPAIDLSSTGIDLHSGDAMLVQLGYDGTTLSMTITDMVTEATWSTSWTVNIPATVGGNTAYVGFTGGTGGLSSSQKILTWTYSNPTGTTPAAATPTFTPTGGSFTAAQSVTIADSTTGASIYYTTDGSTPTTSSTLYSAPITVGTTETLKAIAVAAGYTSSAVATGTFTITITPVAATPVFTPKGGTYTAAQSVTISDTTAGASLYYTTDGSTPTTASTLYSTPITVSTNETVKAIAVAGGYTASAVGSAVYTITVAGPAATPTFTPAGGAYSSAQSVTISDATAGAAIYYTTNGAAPTTSSTLYSGPITVSATETLNAIAVASGYTTSAVGTAAYTITSGSTVYLNYPSMGFTTSGLALNNGASVTGGALVITDGNPVENRSAWFTTAVPVQTFVTDFTFQQTNASADGMTFAIQGQSPYVTGGNGGYLGYGGIGNSIAVKFDLYSNNGEGSDSTGFYTNGAVPETPAIDLSSTGINFHSSDIFHAHLVYDGTTLTMTLTDTVTNASVTESTTVNIPSLVGGNTAYVGFTGGTGGLTATQEVLSWSYAVSPSQTQTAATPTFSPAPATYTSAQSVTLSDTTTGAAIYYTTNGATPTTSSTLYSAPITVSSTETLNAIAVASGYTNSATATGAYTITQIAATPTFSPVPATYTSAQSVTLSDTTTGAAIYYTTNGTTPTTSSTLYSAPIAVSTTETLKAIAVASGYTNSATATGAYTITQTAATPTFSPAPGSYNAAQSVTISDTTTGAAIYYTTNGTTPTTSSTLYSAPIAVSATETLKAIAVASGYTNSTVATGAYTISTVAATPVATPAAGNAYITPTSVTLTDATPGASIYYTTNSTNPTTSSTLYTGPFTVNPNTGVRAIAIASGYTNSAVLIADYNGPTVATPVASPTPGSTYTGTVTVTLTDTTPGTTIYYTTNSSTPTTSSTVYTGPFNVVPNAGVRAIGVASGYATSAILFANYTSSGAPTAATPTFSPAAGSYTSAQSVTISDTTAGAAIYYTTNGATPTTSSTLYSAPITVSATETLKAIAVASNYLNSAVATAAYTITGGTTAATTYVNYPAAGFTAANLSLNDGPTVTGGSLVLTDGGEGEARSAWFATLVPVQSFTTDFTFQQTNASADGMTFAIQNQNVWALGGNGGSLGYQGIPDSVAVKFDLYSNSGEGSDSTGFYTNGASPTLPSTDLSSTAINFHSGDVFHAHLVYDGTTLTMTLTDTVTNASVTEQTTINIPSIVGGNTAWVGFTGGTGGLTATQTVLSWSYSH
ncbi:chitobiase/beta-hexosaminidase C-terminal domain-containing protein [Paracidobacterium acidisoli]|nr:chitobiase/beta-hexosaminidase C-terminal domain-containing protein [Paracidobacterium acidisoli]MBT9332595.1 chitobiase/beta-hexosaminidase C-terminal domain-containing protein [Paracidobacterium acidisoli]